MWFGRPGTSSGTASKPRTLMAVAGVVVCSLVLYASFRGSRRGSGDEADAGGADSGEIRLRILNAPAAGAVARLAASGEDRWTRARGRQDESGSIRFSGLSEGTTYSLAVGPTEEGLCAWVEGLAVGTGVVEVTLMPGKTIRGSLAVPRGATEPGVWARRRGIQVEGTVDREGLYEIRGLAEGVWTVHAAASQGERWLETTADVESGTTADLAIRDD